MRATRAPGSSTCDRCSGPSSRTPRPPPRGSTSPAPPRRTSADEERGVDLVHHGRRVARMARIRRVLLGDRGQDRVLALRLVRVLRGHLADGLEAALDRAGPRREVVVLTANEVLAVAEHLVDDVLPRRLLVLRELPDQVHAHHVLVPETHPGPRGIEASHVSSASAAFPEFSADRAIEIAFSATDRRPGEEGLVVGGSSPGEDLVGHAVPVDVAHDLQRLDRALSVRALADDDAVGLVLDEAAVAIEK